MPRREVRVEEYAMRFIIAKLEELLDLKAFTEMPSGPANGPVSSLYGVSAPLQSGVAITSALKIHIIVTSLGFTFSPERDIIYEHS
jgi:hypothetical protein